jgi:multiple sugar transport system ATP-binding protein
VAVVELDNVSKRYPGSRELAVEAFSLTITDGEFMVLLGPSGCGKSTALRMIAGLESITAGTLRIDDQVMNTIPAKDRDIAMVFQSYALYPHMTVEGNLAFGLKRRGIPKTEIGRRVKSAAAMLGLTEFLGRKPYALSGGQRQRVALGRAIVRDPKVFLFDEPLSNLDAALRVSTRNELVKQHQRLGATMIYVTHDQVEAMTMGERICIINQGKLVQVGKPLDVYRKPADTFVARFLGNPPMNLMTAHLSIEGQGVVLKIGPHILKLHSENNDARGPYDDKRVIFGIRPEDTYDRPPQPEGERFQRLPATVTAVEALGAETLLVLNIDGLDDVFRARFGRDCPARAGDAINIYLDVDSSHLFSEDSTRAIS